MDAPVKRLAGQADDETEEEGEGQETETVLTQPTPLLLATGTGEYGREPPDGRILGRRMGRSEGCALDMRGVALAGAITRRLEMNAVQRTVSEIQYSFACGAHVCRGALG